MEGGYTVTVPSLPGCVFQGKAIVEAMSMAKDAIELYIASLAADGEAIPREDDAPLQIMTIAVEAAAA